MFKNHLALLVGAFVFFAPFLVFLNLTEENELFTIVAGNLEDLNKLTQNVRAWPHSELTWALERTALWPLCDAGLTEKFSAIVALHWIDRNFEADSTNQRVFQLLVHLSVHDSLNVISTMWKPMVAVLAMLVR